jgi:hypothetical protein
VRLEGLGKFKNPITSSGSEPANFRLIALCLKQLRYLMTTTLIASILYTKYFIMRVSLAKNMKTVTGLLEFLTGAGIDNAIPCPIPHQLACQTIEKL